VVKLLFLRLGKIRLRRCTLTLQQEEPN
jgi:hypothetical protein